MGFYNVTNAGGMSSYRNADAIYLNNGAPFSVEDEVSNDDEVIGYTGVIDRIEVRARAPQLLDIRITVNDDGDVFIREILHCGTFTIVWSE